MLIYLLIIFSSYFLFIILMIAGLIKIKGKQSGKSVESFVTVVVAVRNEETTLPNLIQSFVHQTYPKDKFEIILVDDHSTDKTSEIISQLIERYPELKINRISSQDIGKKKAITRGVEVAQGEVILTTDGDCIMPHGWIEGMVDSFKKNTQLVIGAVKVKTDQTFFSKLQAMEFSSVLGSGIALQGLGQATMCNGASLAFRKSAFQEVKGYEGNFEIPSGDDEFLMRKIDKHYVGGIAVVSQKDCVVETKPLNSLNDFVQQRLRWAGKWKANDSVFTRALAVFVLLIQISWLFVLGVTAQHASEKLLLLVLFKILIELSFFLLVSNYLKQRFHIVVFFVLQILYPFYVIYIAIASQVSTYTWRGR